MGHMKSVDVVLTAHKLSEPQKNAVVELLSGGFNTAKPNTIKSLINKDLVRQDGVGYFLEESFRAELKEAYSQPEAREVKSLAASMGIVLTDEEAFQVSQESVEEEMSEFEVDPETGLKEESIESLLQGDPWELGDRIEEETQEAYQAIAQADVFDSSWADWEKELAGFGATLDWKGTEVWDGLTATEIREDMDTATPVGRSARRVHYRTLRNAFRRMDNKTTRVPTNSRKAKRITGARTEPLFANAL